MAFKIYLPRVEDGGGGLPKAAAPAFLEGKETVMVVEDEPL
jgi:hypothetical protein